MSENHGAAFGQKCSTEFHQASDLESSLSVRWRERKNPWSEHARGNIALPLHTLPDCIRYMMIPAASRHCCVCIVMQYLPKTQYSYGMASAQIQLIMGQSRMVSGSRSLARCHDAGSCVGSLIHYIGNTSTQVYCAVRTVDWTSDLCDHDQYMRTVRRPAMWHLYIAGITSTQLQLVNCLLSVATFKSTVGKSPQMPDIPYFVVMYSVSALFMLSLDISAYAPSKYMSRLKASWMN
jgi:hypothetical protein